MPAYSVMETDEGTGGIVFAPNKRAAIKAGASLYADGDRECVTAERRKDLDLYEGKGVPASRLVSEGWWFECHGCGMDVNADNLEDEGLPVTGVVGTEGGAIYCCHTCRRDDLTRTAAANAFGAAFQDMLRDMVRARFGDVEFALENQWKNYVYVPAHNSPLAVRQARVAFNFPGQKFDPATLEYRHEGVAGNSLVGPVKPHFMCCAGDKGTFEAWAEIEGLAK